MKNAAIVIVTSIMLLTIVSCEDMMGDFLEKAPGVDVTEDTIFSSRSQVEMFLASIYEYGVPFQFEVWGVRIMCSGHC